MFKKVILVNLSTFQLVNQMRKMKILVFDNYDSFTYNLVHLVEKILHQKVDVYRNDQLPLEKVKEYDKIILSPGPGVPQEAGLLLPLIKEFASSKSILGVCLGHQGIGEAFGGKLINLSTVYHGVATNCQLAIDNCQFSIANCVDAIRHFRARAAVARLSRRVRR